MNEWLIRLFVRPGSAPESVLRSRYGVLSGVAGIVINVLLTAAKCVLAAITGSVAIAGDALNNLSDAGSSVMSLVGFKIASRPADEDHPYGHGRVEYLCAMGVAVLILLMGADVAKSSVEKIINPQIPAFSWTVVAVLVISIGMKLWLALFNRAIGKKIDSGAVDAVVTDSLGDMAITAVSALSLILSHFLQVSLDGWMGLVVSGFVLWAGVSVFRNTLTPLLGQSPDPADVQSIVDKILAHPPITGVHDLIIHDYGPNKRFVIAHAEIPSDIDVMLAHDVIDDTEREIQQETGYMCTLHMDPLVVDDEKTAVTRSSIREIIKAIDERLSIHDFRMVSGPQHTNLIFDLVIPYAIKMPPADIVSRVKEDIRRLDETYFAVITVDRSYHSPA